MPEQIDDDLILKSFVAESKEGLEQMEQALLALEDQPGDMELVASIFRVVHTMKGNAGILDLKKLLAFTHTLEDLLDLIREGTVPVTTEITSLLLAALDVLREKTAAAASGKDRETVRAKEVLRGINRFLKIGKKKEKQKDKKQQETTDEEDHTLAGSPSETAPEAASATATGKESARTLRVDVEKLDRLLNLAGEIAIARGRMWQLLERGETAGLEEIREAHSFADSLHIELQEVILKARMVPIGPLLRQYKRTVRDLAETHGKSAQLVIAGEDVEVDTSVVEGLRDPLLHMIRNAVDHGIEVPAVREGKGKPPSGTITVRAAHEGSNIAIDVSDDGAGLDRKRIAEVALKRRVAADAESLSDNEVYQLIFESGFSTASEVSDLSGRGVGMDVVRRNVQALRGTVNISSRPGLGSTVQIRLPLTLAIIEGFGVGIGSETFVIPVDQVTECVELPTAEIEHSRKEGILQLRNEPLPFLYLKDHFGLPGSRAKRQNIVVVQHEATRAGLAVDVLHGATQTVIKPLPGVFKEIPGISGSAILGNGRVALILDVPALLRDFRVGKAEQERHELVG